MGIIKERVEALMKGQGIRSLDVLLGMIQNYQPSLAGSSLSQHHQRTDVRRGWRMWRLSLGPAPTVADLIGEVDDPAPELGASWSVAGGGPAGAHESDRELTAMGRQQAERSGRTFIETPVLPTAAASSREDLAVLLMSLPDALLDELVGRRPTSCARTSARPEARRG